MTKMTEKEKLFEEFDSKLSDYHYSIGDRVYIAYNVLNCNDGVVYEEEREIILKRDYYLKRSFENFINEHFNDNLEHIGSLKIIQQYANDMKKEDYRITEVKILETFRLNWREK